MNSSQPADDNSRYGIPSTGSPLHGVIVGSADLDRSVRFYNECLGLDVVETGKMAGPSFEAHWRLAPGSTARFSAMADRGSPVGRVILIEFDGADRETVRTGEGQRFFGLVNLNFYTRDIYGLTDSLAAYGGRPWSPPIVHDMGETIGQPIEVMIDGPDGVIINLIQLESTNPSARILRTVEYIDRYIGYNRRGSTAVATSQHCVKDRERAMSFYVDVLGMTVRNDTVLQGADMEAFMHYPPGAKTRDTYVQGNHIYGKIATNHPLNFECADLTSRAVPPAIGLLAYSFVVPDLGSAMRASAELEADVFSEPVELSLPGLGQCRSAVVRNPGSGALHQLIET